MQLSSQSSCWLHEVMRTMSSPFRLRRCFYRKSLELPRGVSLHEALAMIKAVSYWGSLTGVFQRHVDQDICEFGEFLVLIFVCLSVSLAGYFKNGLIYFIMVESQNTGPGVSNYFFVWLWIRSVCVFYDLFHVRCSCCPSCAAIAQSPV